MPTNTAFRGHSKHFDMATRVVLAAAATICAAAQAVPVVIFHAPDTVELVSNFVRTTFNLTRGSLDVVQVCPAGVYASESAGLTGVRNS